VLPPREFIKRIKPFSLLSEEELDKIVSELEVEAFEEGSKIFERDKNYVYLVYSGKVALYENGELVDVFSKGEIFGIRTEGREAVAEEDTICYLIRREVFEEILENNRQFSEFFKSFERRRLSRIPDIFRDAAIADRIYLSKVRDLISKRAVVCSPYTSIRDAAIKMELSGVGSIVVVDEDMRPVGILTSKDLRAFVIHGKTPEEKVSAYMSSPVITIDSNSSVFEAHMEMLKKGINHLVVTRDGKVEGVITSSDILTVYEPNVSIAVLHRRLRKARDVEEIKSTFKNLKKSIAALVLKGAHFYDLSSLLADIYDYLVKKVIEIELEKYGSLPNFVWVHMGSSARREQIIATDQDNAIIHSGDDDFKEFGRRVCETLDYIGIPKCEGGYMASNWCMEISEWKRMFSEWFNNLKPENIRYLSVFLDMRAIYGDYKLLEELFDFIESKFTSQSLRYLAHDATLSEPPLGLLGLRVKKEFDLKMSGIYPIVNGARVLALENGFIRITNTKERLEKLGELEIIDSDLLTSLKESYEFLQDLRLRNQAKGIMDGKKLPNVVNVSEIDKIEALVLKECFKAISRFQKFLKGHFSIERGL